MSSKAQLVMYERVSLIPFKRKGQLGTIKFIGEIEGKNTGNWVGIELDEEKGDCDGD
jgi:dynactin complex subunit